MATLLRAVLPFYFHGQHQRGDIENVTDNQTAKALINSGDAILASTPIPPPQRGFTAIPNTTLTVSGLY